MSTSNFISAVATSPEKQDHRGLKGLFTPAEIARLTARSDLMGASVVAGNWLAIAACFFAMAYFDSLWAYALGTCLIAGRQLGLGILQHEGAHGTLFKTRWLNDRLTDWLCARPVWQNLHKYRKHHIITNAAIFGVLYAAGHPGLYGFWVLAFVTALPLFIRIRSIAEHGCLERGPNVFENTRTTHANWLARITVAPHHVNFHREHHLMASVPCYHLPELHALLRKKGLAPEPDSYWDVMKLASGKTLNGVA